MPQDTRRSFFQGIVSAAFVLTGGCAKPRDARSPEGGGEDVAPAEDLMREHGVLNRVLLVYDEAARRLEKTLDLYDLNQFTP